MRRSSTLLRAAEEEEAAALASQQQQRQQGQGGKSPRRVRTSSGNGTVSTSSATPTPTPPPPPTQPVFASSTSASTSNPASSQRRTSPPIAPPPADADADPSAGEGEANLSLPHLVSQLSSAVKALAQQSTSPQTSPSSSSRTSTTRGLNAQGLPSPPREREREDRDELRKEFERRRKESDRRRRELEVELEGVEARGLGNSKTRQALLEQLADTYSTEQELGFKVDELRRSIEEMGVVVGGEVAAAVGETLKADGRTRAKWLAWVFGTQLLLFLLFLRLANQHTSSLFPTLYHDPFSPPALFHLPPLSLSSSSSSAFSPATFAALAPTPSLAGESVAGRVWATVVRALPFSSTAAGSAAAVARGAWAVVPS